MSAPWFGGGVAAAVARANAEQRIFMVFLADESDSSRRFEELFAEEQVRDLVASNLIGLRLVHGSIEAAQFEELRSGCTYPSVHLIHASFQPRELTEVPSNATALYNLLTDALNTAQPTATSAQPQEHRADQVQASTQSPRSQPPEHPSNSSVPRDIEERLRRARERVTQAALENEKNIEKNRREQGRVIVDAKRQKELDERKKIVEEQKKQKAAAEAVKHSIMQQIESDKAERRARRERGQVISDSSSNVASSSTSAVATSSSSASVTSVRLSIRLLDGTTLKETFKPSDSLVQVREFVKQKRTDGDGYFVFATTLPLTLRVFTSEDEAKTLVDLGLTPTASLVLKSRTQPSLVRLPHGSWSSPAHWYAVCFSLFNQLRDFLYLIFRWVYDPPIPPVAPTTTANPASPSYAKPSSSANTRQAEDTGVSSNVRSLNQRRKSQGNQASDDDDKNLYNNGNSTQYGGH